jgi:hypothetical protein
LKNGAFFVNNRDFEGTSIDSSRLNRYAMATEGNFPVGEFKKRQEFFDAGSSLCYVSQQQVLDGQKEWVCTCVRYWKTTACQHTYLIKYGKNEKLEDSRKIKKNKAKTEEDTKTIEQYYDWKQSGFGDW